MAEYVKIGFIGCGGNARGHMGTLNKMDDVKIDSMSDKLLMLLSDADVQG